MPRFTTVPLLHSPRFDYERFCPFHPVPQQPISSRPVDPGGGCGSIDSPFSPNVAQPGLSTPSVLRGLSRCVSKVRRRRQPGSSLRLIGFKEELAVISALASLRSHPSESGPNLHWDFAYGVFAPLLAAETKVAGISVWGTSSFRCPGDPGRSEVLPGVRR
jgi:hypothetical protein